MQWHVKKILDGIAHKLHPDQIFRSTLIWVCTDSGAVLS